MIYGGEISDSAAGVFPFKVQPSNVVLHAHRGVTSSLKLNLFDPDGHRRILIYRKQHTVPFITVAHLRVILTFSLMIKCVVVFFLVLNLSTFVLSPNLMSNSVSEVQNGTNCYLLSPTGSAVLFYSPHSCSETKAEP